MINEKARKSSGMANLRKYLPRFTKF